MFKKGHTPWNKDKRGYNISTYIKSAEHRQKLSEAVKNNPSRSWLGKTIPIEIRQKISNTMKLKHIQPSNEAIAKAAVHVKNSVRTLEHRRKLSIALKGKTPSENTLKAVSEAHKGKVITKKHRELLRTGNIASWNNPERREKRLKAQKISCNKQEFKDKSSRNAKQRWENPEYKDRVARASVIGANLKPNKKEMELGTIIELACPKQYKYTGAGDFVIGGKIPDFVNINGKKKAIELFGDYWHRNDNPQDRIDIFAQYGYQCLVIWERELKAKTIEELVEIIRYFNTDEHMDIPQYRIDKAMETIVG
jgi:hypothetical protein